MRTIWQSVRTCPRCPSCQCGGGCKCPWWRNEQNNEICSAEAPGDCVSVDQLKSSVPGLIVQNCPADNQDSPQPNCWGGGEISSCHHTNKHHCLSSGWTFPPASQAAVLSPTQLWLCNAATNCYGTKEFGSKDLTFNKWQQQKKCSLSHSTHFLLLP